MFKEIGAQYRSKQYIIKVKKSKQNLWEEVFIDGIGADSGNINEPIHVYI